MSRRIFVNTTHDLFKTVVENGKGPQFGLGPQSEISPTEQEVIKPYELYFDRTELEDKKRKIKVLFDSITDPAFFSDGAIKVDKLQNYISQIQVEIEKAKTFGYTAGESAAAGSAITIAAASAAVTYVSSYIAYTAGAVNIGQAAALVAGASATEAAAAGASGAALAAQSAGSVAATAVSTAFLPIAAYIAAILSTLLVGINLGKQRRQQGREDNAASWKMTRKDFPNINSQAIMGSPTRRSLERLYDSRTEFDLTFNRNQVDTEEALVRIIREGLADALFTKSQPNADSITLADHPTPGMKRDILYSHFSRVRVSEIKEDRLERTYVDVVCILISYMNLIDRILDLQTPTLSRTPDTEEARIFGEISITLRSVNVPLFNVLSATARQVIREKVLTFFDSNREYKTILNFGEDRQYLAEAWRPAPKDSGSVQFKLTTPLQAGITLESPAFVSRELAKSVIDNIEFELAPLPDLTPYLRPANIDSKYYVDSKMAATNVTLTSLGLVTASAGAIENGNTVSYGDAVFRRWFTGDFKSSELNIDFTNYNNFVYFGSAYKRLEAFTHKLEKIEELTSASAYPGASTSTISAQLKAREKEEIIRNFDPYEQFLYYATSSVYSASAFYAPGEIEYNTTGSWPKQADGTVHSPYSTIAENWLETQLAIAQRYDDNNQNYLVLNLPKYIQEDADSSEFLTFFGMIGHLVDNIKVYIDQFPYIYSTQIDPLKELTMDQAYEVAQSFGLKLPNVYALENLQSFNAQFEGENGTRSYVAETWKRFLHSLIYFAKTKGSRTSLDALLKTYGINSPVLQIKETTHPSVGDYIKSDELTYGLKFTSSMDNHIQVPFVSSSITASTLQISFNPLIRQASSLVTANNWAIDLVPHPSASLKQEYGRVNVVSGSGRTIIASSSYFKLFGDDYTNIMLRSQSADISIIQTDGDQILFQESASANLSSLWNNTTFVYVGGSGSNQLANNFDGIVDEVRIWGENISNEDFISQAYDPGSYYGANYTSSYTSLYVHIPFSQPLASVTESVRNESPYQNVSIVQTLPALNFTTASFTRVLRTIKQSTPIVGSTVYTNRKIKVASPPVFNRMFVDADGTRVLSRITSIKQVEEKQYDSGQNVVYFAISPTDFINQNIIRSMGVIDVNNIIGSPRYITGSGYSNLELIQRDYLRYFNKTVNPNEYIRFFKDLIQGPSEVAEDMVPARTKLLDGIVIESPVLHRNKDTLIRSFKVDGSATKALIAYTSGSGSAWDSITTIGAYDFSVLTEPVVTVPDTIGDSLPLTTTITILDTVNVKSSTKPSKMSRAQRVIQKVNNGSITGSYTYATASILDNNSSFATLEANPIDTETSVATQETGYPRNSFVGIPASQSIAKRLDSEDGTLIPFYDIPPRADFFDVGTISYFHKPNSIYSYDIYTLYKQPYVVKLDTKEDSPLDRLFSPVTLLPTGSVTMEYGRNTTTIQSTAYDGSSRAFGTIKVANIFTLYGINGASGLRLRLYRNTADQSNDITRDFYTPPTPNSGVLFDALLNGAQDVFPYTMLQANDALIYYTIDNLTPTTIQSAVVLEYFAYEPDNLAPKGYLPRHYKFSRDNGTALKRRNYIGCKTTSRTFGKESPVTITLSNSNTLTVVSDTTVLTADNIVTNIPTDLGSITFGGGGQLGVGE